MLELLYSFLVIFGFFFIFIFFCCPALKPIKIIILTAQLVLCFALFSKNFYKKHSLWKEPEYINIHDVPYYPIKAIHLNNYGELSFEKNLDTKFSIIETEEYSNECLKNYFIKFNEACPITDIILDNEIKDKYENYTRLKINENLYLYYTNNYKYGKLYDNPDKYLDFSKHEFDYENIQKIKIREENKLKNPFVGLKNYSKISDFVCLALIIFSYAYIIIESCDDRKMSYFKISNIIIYVIIFILYLIRFIKFIKIKKFLFENKEIYTDEKYFPNKVFNIDSFTVAFSLNVFLFNILFILFPDKPSACKKDDFCDECFDKYSCIEIERETNIFIILLSLPFILIYIFFPILEFINDLNIKKAYKNILYNWNTSPIKSIELNNVNVKDYEIGRIKTKIKKKIYNYSFYDWKDHYFKIEKLDQFNYINLYENKNGKICGKDSYGNNFYFPENVECPINDILITDSIINLTDYTKISLGNNYYLCYTNKKTDGEIVIDIKASSLKGIQLNLESANEICEDYYESILKEKIFNNPKQKCKSFFNFSTYPFYKKIDEWNYMLFLNIKDSFSNENIYLYSINYLGIDSSLKKEKEIIKNINIFNSLSIFKFVLFIFNTVAFSIMLIILANDSNKSAELVYSIIMSVILVVYIIISIISLSINLKYIQKIMNKANKSFLKIRIEYTYNIIIIIYGFILLSNYLIFIIYSLFSDSYGHFDFRRNFNNSNPNNVNNVDNWPRISNLSSDRNSIRNSNRNSENNNYEININQSNHNNNEILNNVNIINVKGKKNKDKNNLYPKNLNKSFTPETNNIFKEFDPINIEPVKSGKGNLCVYCGCNPSKIIFSPCGHRCLCQDCYITSKRKIKNCPICRKDINNFIENIFDS